MSDFDSFLFRKIHSGEKFEKLIPKTKCQKIDAGTGNTDHSIDKMIEVVQTYSWQMDGVADLLKKSSLKNTVGNIYDFCYNHFQYKADKAEQMLRSPACSWKERYTGIDCKSYSIIASSILTEMDLLHYIRKVKQPGSAPSEFTHVYVIVPVDQNAGTLLQGYYVIDGTTHDNKEVVFTQANDSFMEGLQHSILNGPSYGLADPTDGTGGGDPTSSGGAIWSAAKNSAVNYGKATFKEKINNWFSKINFKSVGKIFNFSCLGKEALNPTQASNEIASITTFTTGIVKEMNDAAAAGNMALVNQKYNEYCGYTGVLMLSILKKLSEGWNPCTRQSMEEIQKAVHFYFDGAMRLSLDAWRDQYFTTDPNGPKQVYSAQTTFMKGVMPFCSFTLPFQAWNPKTFILTKKPQFENIPPFMPTSYTYSLLGAAGSFNPQTFLNTLQQGYNIITNPGALVTGTGSTTVPGGTYPPGTTVPGTTQNLEVPKPTQAGLGVLGYVMIAGALFWGGMELFGKNEPLKKQ